MSTTLAHWRATYAPGNWIVLAGPTSLVVIQPLAAEWTSLVEALWQEVLACSTIVELAEQLAAFGIADMPSFGAFFWGPSGMRSLVRGGVVVRDVATGRPVANGQGVQTWNEVGLGDLQRIRVEFPRSEPGGMELPLVVGAAFAAALTLDASAGAVVRSPQGDQSVQPGTIVPVEDAAAVEVHAGTDDPDTEGYPDAVRTLMENASTELMPVPDVLQHADGQTPGADAHSSSPLAALAVSDGQRLDLVGVVRIGRAPGLEPSEPDVQLVTVASPQQDISRTHLQIHPYEDQIVVIDLNSTNGTTLVLPGSELYSSRLPPGEAVAVPLGSRLELGDGVSVLIELPAHHLSDPLN